MYVNQLAANAGEADEETPADRAQAALDEPQYVHLRFLFEGDPHTDMDPEQEEHDDDGLTAAPQDAIRDYPGNWPGGSP